MSRKIVVNSTPIIALGKCGRLNLLRELFRDIIIPEAVYREVTAKDDDASLALKNANGWIHIQRISNDEDKKMYSSRLHEGEVEVLILAQEINADLVLIDDYAARNTAKYLHLTLGGTLGVLMTAKDRGIIESVSSVMNEMEMHNIYYSEKLKKQVKAKAGEG